MSQREQTIAGKPVCIIGDITRDLDSVLPKFSDYGCVVLISKPNSGKSTSATNMIFNHFNDVEYFTLTEHRDNGETYRESTIELGQEIEDKIVIVDELNIDGETTNEELEEFICGLLKNNKVIILSNPYGMSPNPETEVSLFLKHEPRIPDDTLFVFVTN